MIISTSEQTTLWCVQKWLIASEIQTSCKRFFPILADFCLRSKARSWREIATPAGFEIQLQFITTQNVSRTSKNQMALSGKNSISFDSWCNRSETGKSEELIDPSDTQITLNHSKGNDVNIMEMSEAAKAK